MLPADLLARTPPPHAVTIYLQDENLPWVAEYPHFCWGQVDYGTRGDCRRPADRRWTWLEVKSRVSDERILVFRAEDDRKPASLPHVVKLEGSSARALWRAAILTMRRVPSLAWLKRRGHLTGHTALAEHFLPGEDLDAAWERCEPVRRQYASDPLRPLDTLDWWGGWKWEGTFSSAGSQALRSLMRGLAAGDPSALPGIFEDLVAGVEAGRREGYLHALRVLTGESFPTVEGWIGWWRAKRKADQSLRGT